MKPPSSSSSSRRSSSLAAKLALAVGGLVVTLAVLESQARLWVPEPVGPPLTPPGLNRGAFTVPGDHPLRTPEVNVVVHVNAAGFVDREWGPRVEGVKRVVVVGDSFVQAAQVPLNEGFGRALDQALGEGTEVLSVGVPGAGTGTALGLLDAEVLALEPDLVVLGFLVSNDVLNNHPLLDSKPDKPYFRLENGALVPWAQVDIGVGTLGQSWLWQRSHLVRAVGRRVLDGRAARAKVEKGEGIPIDLRVHDPAGGPNWDESWVVTGALGQAMADRCAAAGAGFAVLLFPDAVQATAAGRADANRRWPALVGWDVQVATARAGRIFDGVAPVADLTPALASASGGDPGSPLYLPHDGHWTSRGHAVAAVAAAPYVADWLRSRGGGGR
jgi:hypothetical protein